MHKLQETWHPAGVQGIGSIDSPKRPSSAAASPANTRATLEQLKAQLSAVAAGGNLQLQSLRHSTAPVDAGLELQAQVRPLCVSTSKHAQS